MKIVFKLLILSLFSSVALAWGLFQSGTKQPVMASNVCTYCNVDIQMMIENDQLSTRKVWDSQSVLVIQKGYGMTDTSENSAISKLQSRIYFFSGDKSYATKLVLQSREAPKVKHKLYYQMSLDSSGKPSIFSARGKPVYELEKEISHELWGYYQVIDEQAYVFINEYQHFWNADYSLVHELSHIYDRVSGEYLDKMKAAETVPHALDDLAIEFRAVLAEATYRKELVSSPFFESEVLLKDDFRDELISRKNISLDRVLTLTLDLLFPINFKNRTTQQLVATSDRNESQNHLVFAVMNDFFKKAIEKMNKESRLVEMLGFNYKTVETDPLADKNRQQRAELIAEAQRRGAKDLMDYLVKNNLTQPMTAETVRTDGKFNQWPHKTGGPSPRGGGGSP